MTPEQEKLIVENMPLAHYLANQARDCDHDEAFSKAMEGLMQAALRWDASKGIPFGAFAGQRIRWTIGLIRVQRRRVKRGGREIIFSYDMPIGGDGTSTVLSLLRDEAAEQADHHSKIENDLELLERDLAEQFTPRDVAIVKARFGADGEGNRTLQSIATEHSMSRERVRQICSRVIARLHYLRRLREPGVQGDQKRLKRSLTDQKHSSHLSRYGTRSTRW